MPDPANRAPFFAVALYITRSPNFAPEVFEHNNVIIVCEPAALARVLKANCCPGIAHLAEPGTWQFAPLPA
jgi:hypothetical protein